MDTDKQWQRWGKRDPYFAVLSDDRYREGQNKNDFLASGEQHFDHVKSTFARIGIPLDPRGCALDYGCGVGRVLAPMSRYFMRVTGVDVSPDMLTEAKRNLQADTAILELASADNPLPNNSSGPYAFIHSALVLQHIPMRRGMRTIETLIQNLGPGGSAMIQAPLSTSTPARYFFIKLQKSSQIVTTIIRALRMKRTATEPVMQMNLYPAEDLLALFSAMGLEIRLIEFSRDADATLTQASWYLHHP